MSFGPAGGLFPQMTAARPSTLVCDVCSLAPEVASVDVLARLGLAAQRAGLELRLRGVSPELEGLLGLAGLCVVLGVETGGEAEEGEERVGVEEERELGDPVA
jgi:hypothetical protein